MSGAAHHWLIGSLEGKQGAADRSMGPPSPQSALSLHAAAAAVLLERGRAVPAEMHEDRCGQA